MSSHAKLIVTVDTEEEGLWNGAFRSHGNTVRNVAGVSRFQRICDRFDIRPTYLVDTPVVEDNASVELLRRYLDADECEIGTHLHPWCAEPIREPVSEHNSFLCNLPVELQREKLVRLTGQIERRFGRRPTSFRAGRYGLDIAGARLLMDLGYAVDSSVIPFSDFTGEGGPDFRTAPFQPYFVDGQDLRIPSSRGTLLEVPVSVGFSHADFARTDRIRRFALRPCFRPLRLVGVLDRLNVVRRVKFSPEQADARNMMQLVDAYMANQAPCMVMMLHSSSLVPGYSPYVPDESRLDQFCRDLEATFDYCLTRHQMVGETLTGFARGRREEGRPKTEDRRPKTSSIAEAPTWH